MKKIVCILLATIFIGGTNAYAGAFGVEYMWGKSYYSGPINTIRGFGITIATGYLYEPEWIVGLNADGNRHQFQGDFLIDRILWHPDLTPFMQFYIGAGLGIYVDRNSHVGSSHLGLGVGFRVPVGIRLLLANSFEIYIQGAPTVGYDAIQEGAAHITSASDLSDYVPTFVIPVSGGMRFWF